MPVETKPDQSPASFSFGDRVATAPDVLVRTIGDETVLLNLKTELYLGLNRASTRFWNQLQSSASIQEAFDELLRTYDVEESELRQDLLDFLAALNEQQLIEFLPGEKGAAA